MVQDQVNVHGKNSSSLQWQSSQEDSFLGKFFMWQSWVGGWCVGIDNCFLKLNKLDHWRQVSFVLFLLHNSWALWYVLGFKIWSPPFWSRHTTKKKRKKKTTYSKNCKTTNIKVRLGLTYPLIPLKETTFKVSYGVIKQWLVLCKNKGFVYTDSLLNYIPLRTK